jgi:short subunit dehydrogenase-like uncharacterized protein
VSGTIHIYGATGYTGRLIAKAAADAREVPAALRRSRGATVAVAEAEIEKALFELGRIGLYMEQTSAIAAPRSRNSWTVASFNPARRRCSY